jgi:hypothetical protein
MRLLDTRTMKLESYFDNIPSYAILSHCWEEEEVIFADIAHLSHPVKAEAVRAKKGWEKIMRTCEQAVKDGLDYCWIDTCCIDKSSSAELSEAINSMFSWYKHSSKCYAYVADVDDLHGFVGSKWFTRAWTLQELLAPSHIQTDASTGMEFFSRDWKCLGSKGGLSTTISKATGIPREYLEGLSLAKASISMRMSWAADRQATRAEDIAYSLLGIFDVNMPLLYGEGKTKAFRRLQEEIMRISEDETLFAWESTEFNVNMSGADVLSSDPKDFNEARDLVPFASDNPLIPHSMTHRGLRISLELYSLDPPSDGRLNPRQRIRPLRSPVMIWSDQELVWAPLRCHVAHDYRNHVMVPLRHLAADIYLRDTSTSVALVPTTIPLASLSRGVGKDIYIRSSRTSSISESIQRRHGFIIRNMPEGVVVRGVHPKEVWEPRSNILQGNKDSYGRVSWHASLRLTITRYETSHGGLGHTFLSLGCKVDQLHKQPMPWCLLDDTLYEHTQNGGNLERFHESAFAKNDRRDLLAQITAASGEQVRFRLSIKISATNLFGQNMFVVDIEHEEVTRQEKSEQKLGVPELTTHDKIVGNGGLNREVGQKLISPLNLEIHARSSS